MGWNNAMAWAADLTVGSFSDWRLPVALAPATCTVGIFNCTASELGHLWYSELGNSVGASPPFSVVGTVNTGDFQNLLFDRFSHFWTGTEVDATVAVEFGFGTGRQDIQIKESVVNFPAENQALAVRDGDVLAVGNQVPEPGTLLLTAAALLGLGVWRGAKLSCWADSSRVQMGADLESTPCAMSDTKKVFMLTPSCLARATNRLCRLLGTRATKRPDSPPMPGLGIGSPLFSATASQLWAAE